MLYLPDITGEPIERYVSFDPGTGSLGVAVIDYNRELGTHLVEYATTFQIDRLYKQNKLISETSGDRVAKLRTVRQAINRVLQAWEPAFVASEAPYMGRFPQAYAALVECVDAIRQGTQLFNPFATLLTIDPATVKKTVGVSGKSGDKEAMRKALANRKNLVFDSTVELAALDEHAVDAIAIGIAASTLPLPRAFI